ncbi:hypothetical protein BDZ94DRAFT_143619 [Collybia nuda]|uniref:Carrier domain-containing protein n=1 Tax=Collybia nuda TaxID=64659 RepID=A0A9P6CEL4_9AGAR|nr:hypothetical protein BDZ94DRAFT_143619 [Collybia nuda]
MVRLPPLDGSLHLNNFLDFHLIHNPNSTIYTFSYEDGIPIKISFQRFGRAVHRAALILRSLCGGTDRKVVAMIANVDTLLYQTVTLACIQAGLVPFLISPRNSAAAIDEMLNKMDCSDVIISSSRTDVGLVNSLTVSGLSIHSMPTLADLYGPDREVFSADISPCNASGVHPSDIAFIIHSSGSTGFPKPVPQTFTTALNWMNFLDVSGIKGPDIRICAAMAIPGFHAFGVNFQLLYPLTLCKPAALFPPTSYDFRTGESFNNATQIFPQPSNVLQHIQWTNADMLLSVPSLLTAWRVNPAHVEILKTLKCICCSSGPLPQDVGDDLVRRGVPLCTSYGATEFGIPTYRLPLDHTGHPSIKVFENIPQRLRDWRYVSFNKHVTLRLLPQTGSSDIFELQILTTASHQPAIENLPDARGYATHDIVQAHPTRKGLWRVVGRTDDVIVLSSGEKVVPIPMEDKINSAPELSGALMFGRGHPHCGIIIEPRDSERWFGKDVDLIDAVWPIIEEANSLAPSFGRILREMIIVATRDKPMERVGKGSLARKATLTSFEGDITNTYTNLHSATNFGPPASWTRGDVLAWLEQKTARLIPTQHSILHVDDDIFKAGFDSISAVSLQSQITAALPDDASGTLSPTFVYEHPTIRLMAEAILNMVLGNTAKHHVTKVDKLRAMIVKYSSFSSPERDQVRRTSKGLAVLLTGSTGFLGSYVLEELLRHPDVTKIYAANRKGNIHSSERQIGSFRSKGLDTTLLLSEKVVWLEGDPVEEENLVQWKDQVDAIIHNAWRLDFNLSLTSFEPLIQSTHALLEVCRSSKHSIHFYFTSSTSAAQNWDGTRGHVPEALVNSEYALGKGYGESKHVAEAILKKSGVKGTTLRIGQVAGGLPMGAWATSDWVPAMVKSSVTIGALPSAAGVRHLLLFYAFASTDMGC